MKLLLAHHLQGLDTFFQGESETPVLDLQYGKNKNKVI